MDDGQNGSGGFGAKMAGCASRTFIDQRSDHVDFDGSPLALNLANKTFKGKQLVFLFRFLCVFLDSNQKNMSKKVDIIPLPTLKGESFK